MTELFSAIFAAWQQIEPILRRHSDALEKRLARRRRPTLLRPPRASCLALRATDTRIGPATAAPIHPSSFSAHPSQHDLTLSAKLLRRLSTPVRLTPPGEPHDVVAAKLGVTPNTLVSRRHRNVFRTRHVQGLRGRFGNPVPLLFTPRPLDPSAWLFEEPDPLWGWTALDLPQRIPPHFEQTLTRVAVFGPLTSTERRLAQSHPEAFDHPPPTTDRPRLPKMQPDYVWYKWSKSNDYLGEDCRNCRRSGREDRGWRMEDSAPPFPSSILHSPSSPPKSRKPRPRTAQGSLVFKGWRWLCPACGRKVHKLYLPLPSIDLPLELPRRLPRRLNISEADELPAPPQTFACMTCHRVRFVSRCERNAWNHLIAYLTAGLLYGREVKQPNDLDFAESTCPEQAQRVEGTCPEQAQRVEWARPELVEGRKRPYRPQLNRSAPRRQQVLERLLAGKSIRQIARDLNVSIRAIHNHIRALCRQESVPNRHALAKKLNATKPQPLNQEERARHRRTQTQRLLLAGRTYKQIMKELQTDFSTVNRDAMKIYKHHKVSGRRGLARKLGVDLKTDEDRRIEAIQTEIQTRRAAGQTKKQIAKEMNLNFWAVRTT